MSNDLHDVTRKALLRRLIAQEQEHYDTLSNTQAVMLGTLTAMELRLSQQLRDGINDLILQGAEDMADVTRQVTDALDSIKVAVAALATRLEAAIAPKPNPDDMDAAEALPVLAEIQAVADALNAMATAAPVAPPAPTDDATDATTV